MTQEIRLYGKWRTHGDFLARGCSRAWIDFIHGWIDSNATADFGGLLMRCPVLAFFSSRGLDGQSNSPTLGYVVPSTDAVGRPFPMVLEWTSDFNGDGHLGSLNTSYPDAQISSISANIDFDQHAFPQVIAKGAINLIDAFDAQVTFGELWHIACHIVDSFKDIQKISHQSAETVWYTYNPLGHYLKILHAEVENSDKYSLTTLLHMALVDGSYPEEAPHD